MTVTGRGRRTRNQEASQPAFSGWGGDVPSLPIPHRPPPARTQAGPASVPLTEGVERERPKHCHELGCGPQGPTDARGGDLRHVHLQDTAPTPAWVRTWWPGQGGGAGPADPRERGPLEGLSSWS